MKVITEAGELSGKRVLVRVDWSVPTQNGVLMSDLGIRKSIPTIEYLIDAGAKVILISHAEKDEDSLKPIYEHVKQFLPVTFKKDSNLVLLENLRQNPGEKSNAAEFAQELASKADVYVNEAFSVSHRNHASIVGVPKLLPSYIGFQFAFEIQELSKAFYPKKPFLFILGGAKFDTKLPLLKKFVNIADEIFVGGALANNFFKEQGRDVGDSTVSEGDFDLAELFNSGKIILPEDTIEDRNRILDAGPRTLEILKERITKASQILWNGPLGHYEIGYKVGTLELAKLIAEYGHNTIVGGGDTIAAIESLNILDKFTFVSTGGGAMLDYLATGTLPGIEALSI